MLSYKFEKIKKYLIENLFKNFITFNKTLYFSSMLFIMKINEICDSASIIENLMS